MRRTIYLVAVAFVAALIVLFTAPERIWTLVGGPADQGPVDFTSVQRPDSPNSYLACPAGTCPSADRKTQPIALPPLEVVARVDAHAAAQGFERVDDGADPLRRRYVARTRWLGFPDTVHVVVGAEGEGAGVSAYSRSLIGYDDFDANRTRVEAMLEAITR